MPGRRTSEGTLPLGLSPGQHPPRAARDPCGRFQRGDAELARRTLAAWISAAAKIRSSRGPGSGQLQGGPPRPHIHTRGAPQQNIGEASGDRGARLQPADGRCAAPAPEPLSGGQPGALTSGTAWCSLAKCSFSPNTFQNETFPCGGSRSCFSRLKTLPYSPPLSPVSSPPGASPSPAARERGRQEL